MEKESSQVEKETKRKNARFSQFPVKCPIYEELHTTSTEQINSRTCKLKTEEIKPRLNILKCVTHSAAKQTATAEGTISLSEEAPKQATSHSQLSGHGCGLLIQHPLLSIYFCFVTLHGCVQTG